MLTQTASWVGAATVVGTVSSRANADISKVVKNDRIKQSICRGCLRKTGMDVEQMAATAAKMGILGLDLVKPEDWAAVKKHGLVATMVSGAGGIKSGLNDKSRHPQFLDDFRNNIQAAADAGWPNVICMAGDRKGIGDEEGMDNCETILKEAVKIAEDQEVVICMELLNSSLSSAGCGSNMR
jgi:hydroxypyruvate isomerase